MAPCHLGEQVGGGGRDDQQIGFAGQADVADLTLVVEIEQVGKHALVAERSDRQRRHELLGGFCHDGSNRYPAFPQAPDQVEAFVCGDAAADDEDDTPAGDVIARKACRDRSFPLHVGADLVCGLEGDAVALAEVGDEMAVVDGRDPELGRCQPRAGQEPLDFRQKGLAGAAHHRMIWVITH